MRLQALFCVVGVLGAFSTSQALAECLQSPPALGPTSGPLAGRIESGVVWAAVRGRVSRSVPELLRELQAHEATRNDRVSEMTITPVLPPGDDDDSRVLARQKVSYEVRPFLFVKVSWTEDWEFTLLRGSAETPQAVHVGYRKVEGTSHIQHLCGEIELVRRGPNETEIRFYEEEKATQRTARDTLDSLRLSLTRLENGRN